MEPQTVENVLSELARERQMDHVFHRDGRLNHNALARELSLISARNGGKAVQQSFITRLIKGNLKGKPETLQPMATGFGMSLNEFVSRIRPESAMPPSPTLPPEAAELWSLWNQLPRALRNYFTEQIKNAITSSRRYPDLAAAINRQAQEAANATRVERQRKRS